VWGSVSATAMRAVNLIPSVVAPRPGLLSALDLPLVQAAGLCHPATACRPPANDIFDIDSIQLGSTAPYWATMVFGAG
jgi:hypothetical protein